VTALRTLRHQDAPGRKLLRLRGLRQHFRLQLTIVSVIVASPCHAYEPVKVPEAATGPLHCLVRGQPFAV
jgi:hypothetical protein